MFKTISFYLSSIRDCFILYREYRKPKHLQDKEKINLLLCGSKEKYEEFRAKGYID